MSANQEALYGITWHDSTWLQLLNAENVLDYFSERSNPFYDRTCNNEVIKMQRRSLDQLVNLEGIEYKLHHYQDKVLFVIRKQRRHSPEQVTPLADYYIIAGVIYQAPDLARIIYSRLSMACDSLTSAFSEVRSLVNYHPSSGYSWSFNCEKSEIDTPNSKEEILTPLQQRRIDEILTELQRKFPLPQPQAFQQVADNSNIPERKPAVNGNIDDSPQKRKLSQTNNNQF